MTEVNEHLAPAPSAAAEGAGGAGAPAAPSRRQFSAQVAWTLAARVLMAVNSFAAGVVVARWLGAGGLGALAVLNLAVAYAVQIGSLGMASANTYFIAQDVRRLGPAAANALVFGALGGAALALLTVLFAAAAPQLFEGVPAGAVAAAAASVPFQLITLLGLNIFLALGQVGRFNLLDAAAQSMILVNAAAALVLLGAGLPGLVALNTAASAAVGLVTVWLVARRVARAEGGPRRPDARLFAGMMRYGLKIHLQTVTALLLFRVDLFVVKYFRGAAEAGVYSVATQVTLMLLLLPGVVSTLLFPRIAAGRDERGELACLVTRHTAFVMLLVCAAAVPSVFALPLLYGESFAGAAAQALILLPGVLLVGTAGVLSQHFSGTGLPVAVPLFWLAGLGSNAALNLALVPAYGGRGAALASTLSYALVSTLIAFYFRARTKQRLRAAFVLSRAELRALLSLRALGVSNR